MACLSLLALALTVRHNWFFISHFLSDRFAAIPLGESSLNPYQPQIAGESCSNMQDYFNVNFGRSDTKFSNYEGETALNIFDELYCDGGVVIQTLPTGKKTCSASILYNPKPNFLLPNRMRWFSESASDCFVSSN